MQKEWHYVLTPIWTLMFSLRIMGFLHVDNFCQDPTVVPQWSELYNDPAIVYGIKLLQQHIQKLNNRQHHVICFR